MGPVAFVLLAALFIHAFTQQKRSEFLIPFFGMGAVVGGFVYGGLGFTYRYAGDIWPLVILCCVQFAALTKIATIKQILLLVPLLILLGVPWEVNLGKKLISTVVLRDNDYPFFSAPGFFKQESKASGPPVASKVNCGSAQINQLMWDKYGWGERCQTWEITNLYLGLPDTKRSTFELTFKTSKKEADFYLVYINGNYYHATWDGEKYTAFFLINRKHLIRTRILVTIRWSKTPGPTQVRLLSVAVS